MTCKKPNKETRIHADFIDLVRGDENGKRASSDVIAQFTEDLDRTIPEYNIFVIQHSEGDCTVVVKRNEDI